MIQLFKIFEKYLYSTVIVDDLISCASTDQVKNKSPKSWSWNVEDSLIAGKF